MIVNLTKLLRHLQITGIMILHLKLIGFCCCIFPYHRNLWSFTFPYYVYIISDSNCVFRL